MKSKRSRSLISTRILPAAFAIIVLGSQNAHAGDGSTFMPAFAPSGAFSTGTQYGNIGAVSADFNGDECLDFAIGHGSQAPVKVLVSDCSGQFVPGPVINLLGFPVAAPDLNADGLADLVVQRITSAAGFTNELQVLIATAQGFNQPRSTTLSSSSAYKVFSTIDLGNDSVTDLAIADYTGGPTTVTFLQGRATPSPSSHYLPVPIAPIPIPDTTRSIIAGDFDGDGRNGELAVLWIGATQPNGVIANFGLTVIKLNNLATPTSSQLALPHPMGAMAVGDFNGDGKDDIALRPLNVGEGVILLSNSAPGSINFTEQPDGNLNYGWDERMVAGDLNNDGRDDLIDGDRLYTHSGVSVGWLSQVGNILVRLASSQGSGAFEIPYVIAACGNTTSGTTCNQNDFGAQPFIGDYNGDGLADTALVIEEDGLSEMRLLVSLQNPEVNRSAAFVCAAVDHLPATFRSCFGDADGNGIVNAADRGAVGANIGTADPINRCLFDMDGNGYVNAADRGFVAANIGLCNPLPDYQNGSGLNHGNRDTRFDRRK